MQREGLRGCDSHKALELYDRWKADKIVAERNFGGAMVESTIRTAQNSSVEAAPRFARFKRILYSFSVVVRG
jgi:phage terminase large subunit-like protein